MDTLDPKKIVAAVVAPHGIKIDAKDPMMAVVTLNELALMQFITPAVERIKAAGDQFEEAYIKTQRRAGEAIVDETRRAVAFLQAEIRTDIKNARLHASELILEVHRANKRAIVLRWVGVSLICALMLFVLGFWTREDTVSSLPILQQPADHRPFLPALLAQDEIPFTVRQAALYLGVSRQTVYLWVERKQIPHLRVMGRYIRFLKSELEPFRAQFKQEMENGKT